MQGRVQCSGGLGCEERRRKTRGFLNL